MDRIIWKYINSFILAVFAGAGGAPAFLIRYPDLLKKYWWIAAIWDIAAVAIGIWAYKYCVELHESARADRSSRSPFEANSPPALIALMVGMVVLGAVIGCFMQR